MDDKITDKLWIFLLGWTGLIFAVYPMTKDLAENQPETVSAIVKAIIFSSLLILGFFIFFEKYEKKSLNSLQQCQDDNNKIKSEGEAKYNGIRKEFTMFVENAKKNFKKYYIIRFPQLMLLSFAFTLSAGAQKIDINNWIYYLEMGGLSIFLTFLLAIYDCIFYKVLEKP